MERDTGNRSGVIDGFDPLTRFLKRHRVCEIAENDFCSFRQVFTPAAESSNFLPPLQKLTDDFSSEKTRTADHKIHRGHQWESNPQQQHSQTCTLTEGTTVAMRNWNFNTLCRNVKPSVLETAFALENKHRRYPFSCPF